ncbi:MAG: ATP-binding protein [Rhodanobacter sp.]
MIPPRAAWLLAGLLTILTIGTLHAQPSLTDVATIDHAEAVPASWQSTTPPVAGWVPVKLVDYWNTRWPHHDGVVWYRLHWNQTSADTPVGLLLDYACLANAVYVNGSLIHRDPHLTEPLSRSWVAPQYFLIDQPLLHVGDNTLLVRVSGLVAYQPGFGVVKVGAPDAVHTLYSRSLFGRYSIRQFNFAISAVLGVLFGMFWLLRRKDTVYGWYALNTLFGAGYDWNYVASSPWPFAHTDAFEAFISALFIASMCTFIIFLLRFCSRRWPRTETILLLAVAAAFASALLAPQWMGPWRDWWIMPTVAISYAATLIFLWYATRSSRADIRVLGISMLLPLLAAIYDLALYVEWVPGNTYLGALTAPLSLIGISFAVAWRYAKAMNRVEGFNVELQQKVDSATAQLGDTLAREHALALAHTRIGERMNLVRDLHDGFGGSLLGAIATLEQSPPSAGTTRTIVTLKELRDDLRLVINTTTHEQDADIIGMLAPLRHRWSQRLEIAGIDSRWHLEGLDELHLGPTRSLDLLRLVQETLTNVLKHSGAAQVQVSITHSNQRLHVEISDDGHGFDPTVHTGGGAGLASLRARAARLGGEFSLQTSPGTGVSLSLDTAP